MANLSKYFFTLTIVSTLLISCKKNVEGEGNDEELITTFQLAFTPVGGGAPLVFKLEDLDGPGGTAPVQDTIVLKANMSYNVSLQLFNKSETPFEDITVEIADESDAHRFYYEPSLASKVLVSDLDLDSNGMPLGLSSVWKTTTAAAGQIQITLRHYPGNPPDKASNDPVNSPKSSTDIEANFQLLVK